ncbi:hypothetical protein [Bradyrhizobium icense]|uniref:Uncharacterized protein n=1 Tax=Bradyrhizobium icense TaxID=1274631 RepID=A0A1B1UL36_9BRAD|nr:hypothetical protein [Bradyrhizobium icense]ANW03407.1 hypothetical protein LMTR13_27970 [Bradyrhizobium icense]
MVRKSFRFVLSAMLTGSLATIANAQTGSPQQKPIPPSLMKDCTAHLVEADPRIKIVGPFAPARSADIFGGWASQLAGQLGIVIMAAPAKYPNYNSWAGCIYDPEDKSKPNEGKLVFRKVIREFPKRTKLEPGEAP